MRYGTKAVQLPVTELPGRRSAPANKQRRPRKAWKAWGAALELLEPQPANQPTNPLYAADRDLPRQPPANNLQPNSINLHFCDRSADRVSDHLSIAYWSPISQVFGHRGNRTQAPASPAPVAKVSACRSLVHHGSGGCRGRGRRRCSQEQTVLSRPADGNAAGNHFACLSPSLPPPPSRSRHAKLTRSQCSQTDLVCAALVSKHFHELASAQLYRNFHIIFPDDDDIAFDSPIDGLAGGLDTFTTSDYNYAKHLRDLSMDTLSAGVKGELSYQSYLYSASCGKFLNTLLYLTLKKTRSLESFKWNIRVELSRQVYRELHQNPSLKKLHIRMQAGESYYIPPPPLPVHGGPHGGGPPVHWVDGPPPLPPTMPSTISLPLTGNPTPLPSGPPPSLVPPSKSLPKSKLSRRGSPSGEPSTLSGFQNLKSLSVLDIEDVDIVTELRTCIKNSTPTLKELQLSLSDSLASQARKPPPDSDPDDSDVEGDFQELPTSQNNNDGMGPAKAFRAQEERRVQEGLIGRILDVELPHLPDKKVTSEKMPDSQSLDPEATNEKSTGPDQNAHEQFITSLRHVSDQLMTVVFGTGERTASHQQILETIEKAAKKYVDSENSQQSNGNNTNGHGGTESSGGDEGGQAGTSSSGAGHTEGIPNDVNVSDASKTQNPETPAPAKGADTSSHDEALEEIDMEHVETTNDVGAEFDDQVPDAKSNQEDFAATNPASPDPFKPSSQAPMPNDVELPVSTEDLTSTSTEGSAHDNRLIANVKFLQSRIDFFKDRVHALRTEGTPARLEEIAALERKIQAFEQTIGDIGNQLEAYNKSKVRPLLSESNAPEPRMSQQKILDYLRETRGFALETLSVHLIPVKASVLSRGVDLHTLKQLTLLNVGNQAPIWTLISKENKVQPLPLRNVFTDNVSDAFLTCMGQLEELHDLFMLERNAKSKPESFAPRSSNTMDQIRRVVLAKHMPTLKRLMIKDESSSSSWDANEKAMIYICTRGKQLEELAISLNIQAVVSGKKL